MIEDPWSFERYEHLSQQPNGAFFSACRTWRYLLWRSTRLAMYPNSGTLLVFGINPSDADERSDDHTLKKVCGFAAYLGYGRAIIANPFAFVSKNLERMLDLERRGSDVVGPDNDRYIDLAVSQADAIVAAWGKYGKLRDRRVDVINIVRRNGKQLQAFRLNGDGSPTHPARIPYGPLVTYAT